MQDRITERVIGIIEPHIRRAEIERSRRKRPESLDAYDHYLRALPKVYSARPQDNAEAYAELSKVVAREPDHGVFLAIAAWTLEFRVSMGWPSLTGDDRTACLDLVERALAAAQGDATVLAHCGGALIGMGREYDRGMRIVANAVDANPNNVVVLTVAAIAKLHCGDLRSRWPMAGARFCWVPATRRRTGRRRRSPMPRWCSAISRKR